LSGGFFGAAKIVGHAAAEVEDDSDRHRDVFGRKVHDLLLDVVFEDAKVIGLETCDGAVMRISDCDVDEREIHVYMDGFAPPNWLARRVMLSMPEHQRLRPCGRADIERGEAKE
jgi:hypothetical protein